MSLRQRTQELKEANRGLEDSVKQEQRAREDVLFAYTTLQDTNAGLTAEVGSWHALCCFHDSSGSHCTA